ncbi:hypothetical protein TIFTF001_002790 [Ficus carica]|uniref:Poly [ADP-ribose] polymerase n=1 Tax=Ficus carica TaxID=3494 RepID=A0AA87ZDC0_FICCA|nr:hypothetical protein TIFTF001_002790 [Ficus carica]
MSRCSSPFLQTRLELFEKQIEITGGYRSNVNVQYAWLASSEQGINKIIIYGLDHCGPSALRSAFGVGVHLTSASYAYTSANYCKVGRIGMRRLILCRVILGSLEVVQRGSRLFHPSSLAYDTEVDNLQNPKHYIVWNTNANTHIYPECVVRFQGHQCLESQGQLQAGSSAAGAESNARPESSSSRILRAPWMPFPMLFAILSTEVSPTDMETGKMTRDNFVKILRSIVGDASLRALLPGLQAVDLQDVGWLCFWMSSEFLSLDLQDDTAE